MVQLLLYSLGVRNHSFLLFGVICEWRDIFHLIVTFDDSFTIQILVFVYWLQQTFSFPSCLWHEAGRQLFIARLRWYQDDITIVDGLIRSFSISGCTYFVIISQQSVLVAFKINLALYFLYKLIWLYYLMFHSSFYCFVFHWPLYMLYILFVLSSHNGEW